MASNSITARVAEFLAQFPPFDLLEAAELARASQTVQVQFREAGETLFDEGETPGEFFYVVRQGSVKISNAGPPEVLIDICDEGDIFGVRPLLANEPYLASAQTQEECLIYAIPVSEGKTVIRQNARVALYFAMGYASGKPMQRFQRKGGKMPKTTRTDETLPVLSETILVQGQRKVLTCLPQTPIAEAALKMTNRRVGSIVIVTEEKPLGIVTDKDLRMQVATGQVGIDQPISRIMSSPVKCVKPGLSVAECMIEMVSAKVHHLCITHDGTSETALMGVVSDHDLLLEQGFNPAILIKEMRMSTEVPALLELRDKADQLLQKYLEQEVSMRYISHMMTAVNDTLLERLIELFQEELGSPPCAFTWLSLGSQGRGEQLLRTDQDHALVFADGGDEDAHKVYFLELARRVSQELVRFGFDQDAADIGANQPKWCLPLNAWKKLFSQWIQIPNEHNLLYSNIFFDFRPAYGAQAFAQAMTEHLFQEVKTCQIFLPMLARNAQANPPPLSFFRNFVVEKSGEHKDEFDLKLRAMLPLTDAARILVIQREIGGVNNTARRFMALAELEPNIRELMLDAAEGYWLLMELRGRFGIRNQSSGRYIDINSLSKLQRQSLRQVFSTIDELQKVLRVRFQTSLLR